MKTQTITSNEVPPSKAGVLSQCKRNGDHVYISGMVSWDKDGNIIGIGDAYKQAHTAFSYIKALMEAAGGCIDDVVKILIFTTDIRYREDIWRARREFFGGDFPCSTLVAVSTLVRPALLVEIEAVGIIGGSG